MARLNYWHQSLMTMTIDFPHFVLSSPRFPQMSVRGLYVVLMMHFSWAATGLPSDRPLMAYPPTFFCLYKVPSGSELPTRDMAYHRA